MNDQATQLRAPNNSEMRMNLLAVPSSVVLSREFVRYALTGWGYRKEITQDSMLVMSELVTNAVTAARGHQIRIRAAIQDGAPLLECWDPVPQLPHTTHAPLDAENGRGLFIIAAYAK